MKKLVAAAALIAGLAVYATYAWAGCPPGTRYVCNQGFGGKVICSCS